MSPDHPVPADQLIRRILCGSFYSSCEASHRQTANASTGLARRRLTKERAVSGNCSTYIALTLAAMAAIMSAPGQTREMFKELPGLLVSSAAPEAAALAGAIGERPEAVLPP
jgi:hypothetical protein